MNKELEKPVQNISLKKLFNCNLNIPCYQRPYEWEWENVVTLLQDIDEAISKKNINNKEKQKLGTIIIYKHTENNEKIYDIVDGQQRIISLSLIINALNSLNELDKNYNNHIDINNFLNKEFVNNVTTAKNILDNYKKIINWLQKDNRKDIFNKNICDSIVFDVIILDNLDSAFQLFNSQNTTGKELEPADLLKAYHCINLKDMSLIKTWKCYENHSFYEDSNLFEYYSDNKIVCLFKYFLFPIYKWSTNSYIEKHFSRNDIYLYKGFKKENSKKYEYLKQYVENYYSITNPLFYEGDEFFKMVFYYIELIEDLITKYKILNIEEKDNFDNFGFYLTNNLYYATLLYFSDKFGEKYLDNFVETFKKWALMLRVDKKNIDFESINKYCVKPDEDSYSNCFTMFHEILMAREPKELEKIEIKISDKFIKEKDNNSSNDTERNDKKNNSSRNLIYNYLKGENDNNGN